jgi:hypothetical protein
VRIESWGGRHRVFINGELFDDFVESGFEHGKIGFGTYVPHEQYARFTMDNMICGALRPELAGIFPEGASPPPQRSPRGITAPSVSIERIWLTHEDRTSGPGIAVHAKFQTLNMRGAECEAQFNFLHGDTREPIRDSDGSFASPAGNVAATRNFVPPRRRATYEDMSIFVPYSQLHVETKNTKLLFNLAVWQTVNGQRERLAKSPDEEFWTRRQ